MFKQSQWFFYEFNKSFSEDSPYRQQAILTYAHNTKFTNFITQRINDIIRAKGYIVQNEYYRIDAMGYTNRWETLDKSSSLSPYLWDLEIAVEHENSSKGWLDEVVKLAHIYCPLRVVIGYVPVKERQFGDDERLTYVASVLKQLKCKDNLRNGEFLVILGNSKTRGKESNFFNYKAYVLNKETLNFESLDKYTT